jgi:hypothetical protein
MLRFCEVSTNNSVAIFGVCQWFGDTKTDSCGITQPPAHPENGVGVNPRNMRKSSHLEAAVCPEKISLNSVAAKASVLTL